MITDLPEWVLELVHRLDRSDQSHHPYYNYEPVQQPDGDTKYEYVEVECPQQELINLIPSEVLEGVRLAAVWAPRKENA